MILPVHAAVRSQLRDALSSTFDVPFDEQPAIVIETPPKRAFGDLAVPVAFELARRLRKAPRAIAQELAAALPAIPGVLKVVAAPNGYLNFYLDRAAFLRTHLEAPSSTPAAVAGPVEKTIVEHT